MQIKALLVASLATLSSAAVVQERQIPDDILSLIPSDVSIPSEILTGLPDEIQQIYSQVTGFLLPLATAIPPSLLSEIEQVIATLPESALPSFISSVVSQLPPDVQSSFNQIQASLTGEIGSLITSPPTAAPTNTETVPTSTGADEPSTTGSDAPETTDTAENNGTDTSSPPRPTSTPNSGSRTFVGLSVLGVAGFLGLALAL